MKQRNYYSNNSNYGIGLLILALGALLLLRQLGILYPIWLLSWPMLFIAIGLFVLVSNNFKSGFGYFMLLFGAFFLIKTEFGFPREIAPYIVPVGLMVVGLYILLRRKDNRLHSGNEWRHPQSPKQGLEAERGPSSPSTAEEGSPDEPRPSSWSRHSGDIISIEAFFGSVQKRVLSKNFRGGKASAVFGGTEIDLSQADMSEEAFLNIDVAFGGIKLIVPPHWDVQVNVSQVFAGTEDKRFYPQTNIDPTKILVIRGSMVFGGLEIKSF